MFITRRTLTRYAFLGSLGTLLQPLVQRVEAGNLPTEICASQEDYFLKWAESAEWRQLRCAYPGPAMHNAVMQAMSRRYVNDYFGKNGKLPTRIHQVRYRCGSDKTNDVRVNVVGQSCLRDETFVYPDKAQGGQCGALRSRRL
jgi:hypothetical protein